jgi:serine/threonine protein kinase
VWLILEFIPNGDLKNCLLEKKLGGDLSDSQKLKLCLDFAEGLSHLHKLRIVHRDLAARNLLVTQDMHVKISGTIFLPSFQMLYN